MCACMLASFVCVHAYVNNYLNGPGLLVKIRVFAQFFKDDDDDDDDGGGGIAINNNLET